MKVQDKHAERALRDLAVYRRRRRRRMSFILSDG